MGSLKVHKLPVIDFTNIDNLKPGSSSWLKVRDDSTRALEEYGCFVAEYDIVPLELHKEIFRSLEELFDLPTETKVQNKNSKLLCGYVGQIPFLPLYESMGYDDPNTLQGVQNFTKIMWPNGNDGFSENMLSYSNLVAQLEQTVANMVFERYGVEKYYESHLSAETFLCRVMKYRGPQDSETSIAFPSHTDKDFITVLHQNQVDGLEVQAKDGEWFDVELSPSSFVVMAGDAIMAWSNERIYSPQHRVTMNGKEPRYSLAQFAYMKGEIQTPEELVDENHPLLYKPFNHYDYLQFYSTGNNRYLPSALKTFCGV